MFEVSMPLKEVLSDVAVAVVGLAGAYTVYLVHQATKHVQEKTLQIKDQNKAARLFRAMEQVDEISAKTVEKIEQTVAAELREKVKAGEVDRNELLVLGRKAVSEVVNTLAPEVLQVLMENLGDYLAYIESTVESKVRQVKQETNG